MPVTTSKVFERSKDKCRDVYSDGYEYDSKLFNFTKGVQRHVYLMLVERVKLYGTTTSRIPKREVKIMRGTAL